VKISPGRKSLTLKEKRNVLDLPVFHKKLRGVGESGISPTDPLRTSTQIEDLKRLREKAGFQHSFIQYGLRGGLLNVVNSMSAPFWSIAPITPNTALNADLMHLPQIRLPPPSEIRPSTISREQLAIIWTRRSDLTPRPAT